MCAKSNSFDTVKLLNDYTTVQMFVFFDLGTPTASFEE